ncbi:MAG TPA: TrkH family potassium uptake protein [Bacteroidales bacterium]|nr:TrkH family potassium uptake protein [Bacteroidales bacterium]
MEDNLVIEMKLINPLVIVYILSTILFLEAVSFLFCLPVAIIYNESADPFLWSALVTVSASVIFYLISNKAAKRTITNREGFMSVSLGWIILSLAGSLPFIFSDTIPSFINAFFESTSGFTTTGSSILNDVESLPRSILFWRSFTHWIGGLGIIVLVIIILPSIGMTANQLLPLESSLKEKIHPKTKAVGIRLLYAYLGLTIIEIILLNLGEMDLFESICHTFGTVATGGFSVKNDSISGYSAYSQYIIMIFMFLSGVSFVVYYYIVKLNFRKVKHNDELWFYFGTTVFFGAIATSILLTNTSMSPERALREGFFQVISIITTTGYVSADYLFWPTAGLILIFMLLFAGASTGSTTGGIKMVRHLVILKNIQNAFRKLVHPNIITQIKLNNKPLSDRMNVSIITFVILFLVIFLAGTVLIVMLGTDPVTAASAVGTSLGNTGPGLGSIGPMYNYSHMPGMSKIIFIFLMIIGRLEIYTFFILFSKSFWKL